MRGQRTFLRKIWRAQNDILGFPVSGKRSSAFSGLEKSKEERCYIIDIIV